ncbi:MAG: hypothetical protein V1887_02650 [Candidatus Aenigmatarchaeota archaeon]
MDVQARRRLKTLLKALNADVSKVTYTIDLDRNFLRGEVYYHGAGELEVRPGNEYGQSNIDKLPGSMKTRLTVLSLDSQRGPTYHVRLKLDIIKNEIWPANPDNPQALPEYERELEEMREVAERFGYKWIKN